MATPSARTIRFRNCERSHAPRFPSTFQGTVPVATPCGPFRILAPEVSCTKAAEEFTKSDWHCCRRRLRKVEGFEGRANFFRLRTIERIISSDNMSPEVCD